MDKRPCDCSAEYGPTCQIGRQLHQELISAWQALHMPGFVNLPYGWQFRHKDGFEQTVEAYCNHFTGRAEQ